MTTGRGNVVHAVVRRVVILRSGAATVGGARSVAGAVGRRPVMIEGALNGVSFRDRKPYVPCSSREVADDAVAAADAEASTVHSHGRDPADGSRSHDVARYAEGFRLARARRDVLLWPTFAGGGDREHRCRHIVELAADPATCPDSASDDPGRPGAGAPAARAQAPLRRSRDAVRLPPTPRRHEPAGVDAVEHRPVGLDARQAATCCRSSPSRWPSRGHVRIGPEDHHHASLGAPTNAALVERLAAITETKGARALCPRRARADGAPVPRDRPDPRAKQKETP